MHRHDRHRHGACKHRLGLPNEAVCSLFFVYFVCFNEEQFLQRTVFDVKMDVSPDASKKKVVPESFHAIRFLRSNHIKIIRTKNEEAAQIKMSLLLGTSNACSACTSFFHNSGRVSFVDYHHFSTWT
jgi:hypothetical protein